MTTERVHILLMDDNDRFLNRAEKRLRNYGYKNLEFASTIENAEEKLNNQETPFDIIVADMWMLPNKKGAFNIIEKVQALKLSSIVIIFTANPDWMDCREAFKTKVCFDYIKKNDKKEGEFQSMFEPLHQSIQEALEYLDFMGNDKNELYIKDNKENLERDYWGKYIAVQHQTVVAYADTEKELEDELEKTKQRRLITTIASIGVQPFQEFIKDLLSSPTTFKQDIERDNLEFKQYYKESNKSKNEQTFNTFKAITAFLNSQGGTLEPRRDVACNVSTKGGFGININKHKISP